MNKRKRKKRITKMGTQFSPSLRTIYKDLILDLCKEPPFHKMSRLKAEDKNK